MKTLRKNTTAKTIIQTILTLSLTTLFVWWGMHFPGPTPRSAKADAVVVTCTVTPTPTPTPITDGTALPSLVYVSPAPYPTPPEVEILPMGFQNPNGASMAWIQYGGDYSTKKPGVIVVHPTNWNAGSATDVVGETRDIANAGFFAAAVWYELAPNANPAEGYIPGQPPHTADGTSPGWRMNLEVNDIKNYVRAMRADPRCNGWVAVVGGSAGATHAITVALDTTPSPDGHYPFWCLNGADDRPDCAVMLSAIYDFSDWTSPNDVNPPATDPRFVHFGMHNYAQSLDLNTLASLPLNPVNLVPQVLASGYKWNPIYMINSDDDHPTAYHQLSGMVCLLQSKGLTLGTDYQYLTIPGSAHAFHYWGSWDSLPSQIEHTVGDDVITFLKSHAGLL